MTHVSLFSGIGGIDLAAEWAGFTTIAQVEKDDYCQRVLARHWPDVHRVADIRDFPDRDYGAVTLVSGGFPCQPFSAAGKRRGTADDRHLWPQMLRVVRELAPRWVLAENVPGLLSIEQGVVFETVLADLEREGYTTQAVVVPAAGVGAPHLRYRVFIVGKSGSTGCKSDNGRGTISDQNRERTSPLWEKQQQSGLASSGADVADTERQHEAWAFGKRNSGRRPEATSRNGGDAANSPKCRLQRSSIFGCSRQSNSTGSITESTRVCKQSGWWSVEPDVGRVAHGVPHRVDRLRALGNAVVPQQVYPILKAIAEMERD